jgi:TRAP-type C4-dicarboxylate transport system substrate-binding protein
MLTGLAESTPATGLAFTYSGGFRCLAADRAINTVEDLQGLNVSTSANPVMIDTAIAFGATPVSVHTRDENPEAKQVRLTTSAVETTLPRYYNEANPEVHKYVANTKHSMYLTSIIINTEFWNSLSEEDQTAMRQAALVSSRLERQWSVDDANEVATNVDKQREWGISYAEFSDAETEKLKKRVETVYDKYSQFFTPGLVDGIIKS